MNKWYRINWKLILAMSLLTTIVMPLLMWLFGYKITLANVAGCAVAFPVLTLLMIMTETKKKAFLRHLKSLLKEEELLLDEARSNLFNQCKMEDVCTYIVLLKQVYATKKAIRKTQEL